MSGRLDASGRCVLSDLLPDQCGCKDHRNVMPVVEATTYNLSASVIALFDGTCALNRSHEISVGERITKAEGVGWVCLDCATELTAAELF